MPWDPETCNGQEGCRWHGKFVRESDGDVPLTYAFECCGYACNFACTLFQAHPSVANLYMLAPIFGHVFVYAVAVAAVLSTGCCVLMAAAIELLGRRRA